MPINWVDINLCKLTLNTVSEGLRATWYPNLDFTELDRFGIKTLVIVAEEGSQAERLYQATGFEIVERQIGIGKWNESA